MSQKQSKGWSCWAVVLKWVMAGGHSMSWCLAAGPASAWAQGFRSSYLQTAVEEAGRVLLGSTATALPCHCALSCAATGHRCLWSIYAVLYPHCLVEGMAVRWCAALGRRCQSWLLFPAVPWGSGRTSHWVVNNQTWSKSLVLGFNMGCSYQCIWKMETTDDMPSPSGTNEKIVPFCLAQAIKATFNK